jgi:hypothetical protein
MTPTTETGCTRSSDEMPESGRSGTTSLEYMKARCD